MKRTIHSVIFLLLFLPLLSKAQIVCDGAKLTNVEINFGDTMAFEFPDAGDGEIAHGTSPKAGPYHFNIIDEIAGGMGVGGADDVTLTFEILPTFDPYGGTILETTSTAHKVEQGATGIVGTMSMGTSNATATTSGDVRCYSVTVDFASHLLVSAQDLEVLLNEINSPGEAYESSALVFKDGAGTPYGTATYKGFYNALPNRISGVRSQSFGAWVTTGRGVFLADDPTTVDVTDIFNPEASTEPHIQDYAVNAMLDAGIAATEIIGGFVYTLCLEDVAATTYEEEISSTSALFTSTLNGLMFKNVCLGTILLDRELTVFEGEAEDCDVTLNWITLSETGLERFDIEKSSDGIEFQTIGSTQATGDGFTARRYTFKDADAGYMSYYRLNMVDFDGKQEYSDIIAVEANCKEKVYISQLYPNPVINELGINIQSNVRNDGALAIIDGIGRTIYQFDCKFDKGLNALYFDTHSLPVGFYFIQVILEDKTGEVGKFIKI